MESEMHKLVLALTFYFICACNQTSFLSRSKKKDEHKASEQGQEVIENSNELKKKENPKSSEAIATKNTEINSQTKSILSSLSEGKCKAPIPDHVDLKSVVWGETGVHFYVLKKSWALAALHSSVMMIKSDLSIKLSPSFVFATALKESFMGCSSTVGKDSLHPEHKYRRSHAADYDGCFQIESTTAWTEMKRLFPIFEDIEHEDIISSQKQAETGRDNFETSALALAHYDVFAYAMLTNHGVQDPKQWLASAKDPNALEKIIAVIYNRGAWSNEIKSIVNGCHEKDLEECLTPKSVVQDYVKAVSSYSKELKDGMSRGECYDEMLTEKDIIDYIISIKPMFPSENWEVIETKMKDSFKRISGNKTEIKFQDGAILLMNDLINAMNSKLKCPSGKLSEWYGASCPQ